MQTPAQRNVCAALADATFRAMQQAVIYLPPELVTGEAAKKIRPAIQNHFHYKTLVAERKFRSRAKYGRFTLLVGLSFLFISLMIGQYVLSVTTSIVTQVIATALMVTGWAAMWEPVTVLLYELRPLVLMKKTYQKISTMDIDLLPIPS